MKPTIPRYCTLVPTLGADPEFALRKYGRWISPHRRFPTIHDKIQHSRGQLFRDGFSVELNPEASFCREALVYSVRQLLREAKTRGRASLRAPHYIRLGPHTLRHAPPDMFQAGCEPALSAYHEELVTPEVDYATHPFRYFGGHMHLAYPKSSGAPFHDPELGRALIQLCDRYLGVPLTYIWGCPGMFQRRQIYGRAGEFRFQSYGRTDTVGIEYRTPGPEIWWTSWSASLAFGIFRDLARHFPMYHRRHSRATQTELLAIQNAINTGEDIGRFLPPHGPLGTVQQFRRLRSQIVNRGLGRLKAPIPRIEYGQRGWEWFQGLPPDRQIQELP